MLNQKEQILREIRETALSIGRTPRRYDYPRANEAIKIFGGWKKALQTARVSPKTLTAVSETDKQKTELIHELQTYYQKTHRIPKRGEVKHSAQIYRILGSGSWGRAMQVAGLKPNMTHNRSEEELLSIIRHKQEELGRTPRVTDVPQAYTIMRCFGSWNAAIQAAGMEPWKKTHNSKIVISDQDLLIGIQVLMWQNNGRRPLYREYVHGGLCVRRFGKWSIAVDKAVEDPYHTNERAKVFANV